MARTCHYIAFVRVSHRIDRMLCCVNRKEKEPLVRGMRLCHPFRVIYNNNTTKAISWLAISPSTEKIILRH